MSTARNQQRALTCLAASALCTALTLSGCGSSAPTRYYGLQPSSASTASRAAYRGPALQISEVHIPSELDRDELLREVAPGQFEVREFDHWTAPLGRMAQQTLSEDLSTRLPAGILIYPDAPKPTAAANLSVDILSFRIEGEGAVMQVSWSMRMPPPPPLPAAPAPSAGSRPVTVSVSPPVPATVCGSQLRLSTPGSGDAAGTSAAFSTLLGQLADRIADGLSAGCSQIAN